jgi:hypothetical protein
MAAPKTLKARESFACELDGQPIVVHEGDTVHSTHPLAKAHGQMFEPETVVHEHKPRRTKRPK